MARSIGDAPSFKICIVGAGPAGLYAAEALLGDDFPCEIDVIERLPVPFGLVRFGVAPDHYRLKAVSDVLVEVLKDPRCRLVGNVAVARDFDVDQLRQLYDAVILATGAPHDRPLDIAGEQLPGSHAAGEFIAWYNGHPDGRDAKFDFDHDTVVVLGHGNVAADVARILARPVDELRSTDICEHALDALSRSRIKHIHLVGRRGPAQAKFTPRELRELGTLNDVGCQVRDHELALSEACREELASPSNSALRSNQTHFARMGKYDGSNKIRIDIRFHLTPRAFTGVNCVERAVFDRTRLIGPAFAQKPVPIGETESIPCGLVFRSIGFRAAPLGRLPFDEVRGIVPNRLGRVVDRDAILPAVYVAGWLKRGATGIIGTNRACSFETAAQVAMDLRRSRPGGKAGFSALNSWLKQAGRHTVDFSAWLRIDAEERSRGAILGKPREKFTSIVEMLNAAGLIGDTGNSQNALISSAE